MGQDKGMTVRQVAARLGLTLSYVYHLVWSGKLPARKAGGHWMVSPGAVEAKLRSRRGSHAAVSR